MNYRRRVVAGWNVLLACACLSAAAAGQTFPVGDDFESGLAGWSFSNEDGEWGAAGGNPGGHVRFSELSVNQTYARAPERYLGDWTSLDGAGEIRFDFRVFKTGDYEGGGDLIVRLAGPGGVARGEIVTFEGPTLWRRYVLPLDAERWTVVSGSWEAILAEVAEFAITIDIFDSTSLGETNGLDNVRVGPPCPADFDGDGFVNGADFDGYLFSFESGNPAADFDGDGFVTGWDFDRFVLVFEAGCEV